MTRSAKPSPIISSIARLAALSRRLVLLVLVSYCSIGVNATALQQDGQALQDVQTEIKQQQQKLANQKQQQDELQARLKVDEQAIAKIATARHESNQRQQQLSQQKALLDSQITAINQSISSQKRALTHVVKAAFGRSEIDVLKILFNQQTPSEVQQNIELFKYVSKAHIDKIEQFRATLAELAVVTQKRNQALLELADVIQQQQQQQTALKQQQQAKKTTLTKLKTLISSEGQRLKVLQQSELELQRKIEAARQAMVASKVLTGLSQHKGKLRYPASGKVIKLFGKKRAGLMRWSGIKIEGQHGSPVNSIHQGRVLFSDWLKGFGLVMVIDHGQGFMSLYGHNQALLKPAGASVLAGETIALLGKSGGQKNSALYFEIRDKGRPVNPVRWLQ